MHFIVVSAVTPSSKLNTLPLVKQAVFSSKNTNTTHMGAQNFKNHARYVPIFHFVLSGIVVTILVLSIINLFSGVNLSSVMFLLMVIAFLIVFLKMRAFPLVVQDRAIRAEENLRCFSLTGKLPDKGLTMSQIIALRFADDNEFVELSAKALKDNISNTDIKQAIQNRRPDNHRA